VLKDLIRSCFNTESTEDAEKVTAALTLWMRCEIVCHMMRDAQPLADRLAHLRPELDRIGVKTLYLFGSRARGDARVDSDWDFLVEYSSPPGFDQFMDLKLLLENQLGARVDLLSRTACGQRLLRAIEPELVHAA